MNQTWEKGKKRQRPKFGPPIFFFFFWILPLLDIRNCCKLSLYAISRKTNKSDLTKWQKKTLVLGPILGHLGCQIFFFFKNLARSITRYYGQLTSCIISEKTNDPILIKLNDGWTDRHMDRWTDRGTDGQEWFHKTLSD